MEIDQAHGTENTKLFLGTIKVAYSLIFLVSSMVPTVCPVNRPMGHRGRLLSVLFSQLQHQAAKMLKVQR